MFPEFLPYADWIGGVAALVCTACFVPQVVKAWTSRNTTSLSLIMYVMLLTGNALWLGYGVLIWSMPLIVGNIVTIVLVIGILCAKLRYG